jgi:hypothetical protein
MSPERKESALNSAVSKAAEQLIAGTEATETEVEATTEIEEEAPEEITEEGTEPEETPVTDVDTLSEVQLAEAQKLYRLLSDPKQRGPLIAALAQDAGILNRETSLTVKEEKKAAKAIREVISESLGPEFKFLADRLSPAIEAIVGQSNERLDEALQQQALEKITQETVAATEKLSRETKGVSAKLEKRMQELADEMPPGKGISVEKYVRRLYALAASEAGITPTTTTKRDVQKVRSNANNAADRLHGTTSGPAGQPKIPNKKMNIGEAVQFAYSELSKGNK